jgi:hypothetical protein
MQRIVIFVLCFVSLTFWPLSKKITLDWVCYNRKPQIRFNLYFLELYCILFVYNYCIVVFLFHGENKWKTFRFKHFIRKLEKIFYLRKKLWKDFDDSFHFVTTCRWRYWTKSNRNGKPIKDLKNKKNKNY